MNTCNPEVSQNILWCLEGPSLELFELSESMQRICMILLYLLRCIASILSTSHGFVLDMDVIQTSSIWLITTHTETLFLPLQRNSLANHCSKCFQTLCIHMNNVQNVGRSWTFTCRTSTLALSVRDFFSTCWLLILSFQKWNYPLLLNHLLLNTSISFFFTVSQLTQTPATTTGRWTDGA